MSESVITRQSKKFYEQYQFPGNRPLDKDGLIFMKRFSNSVSTYSTHNDGTKLNVLDEGCGTGNTSVALAKHFRDVEFYAVDNSLTSLSKAKMLAMKNKLINIHFRKWNLLKPLPYRFKFDIIICLGVLHHTANMKKVLTNLYHSIKDDGELYLWIYAQPGRYMHSLNVKLLKMLIDVKPKTTDEISFASEFITKADNGSLLQDLAGSSTTYLLQTKAAADPVWIADQFLNPHEELITMEQLLKLIKSSGFIFQNLLGIDEDVSGFFNSQVLSKKFNKLTGYQRLIALDLLYKPERYFVILRKKALKKGK